MRFLLGWSLKLAVIGLFYAGVTGAIPVQLPDTILGFQVPDAAKRLASNGAQIQELAGKTQANFKTVADSFK